MSRDKKILFGCIAALVLIGLCACCGIGLVSVSVVGAAGPALEGAQVGQGATAHQVCVDAALVRGDACPNMDMSCGFNVGAFHSGCLRAVPADPTAFCRTPSWAPSAPGEEPGVAFCAAHGRAATFGCGAVFGSWEDFCEPYRRGP
ncbi:MAG: hypothetical protein H6726_08745 [Sandaracinaceae bacterium]|nr:hypothetical protein [Sandaracinaceae bacterium]